MRYLFKHTLPALAWLAAFASAAAAQSFYPARCSGVCGQYEAYARHAGASGTYGPLMSLYNQCMACINGGGSQGAGAVRQQAACPAGQEMRGGYCVPQNASLCPNQPSKHCTAPYVCATDLNGVDGCFTKDGLDQLAKDKEQRLTAVRQDARNERNSKAEDEFARTHDGMTYEQWLADQRKSVVGASTSQQGGSYLDRMVEESNARLKAAVGGGGSTDIDRALQGIAVAKQLGANVPAQNALPKTNGSFQRIEQLANSQPTASAPAPAKSQLPMPAGAAPVVQYQRAPSPCDTSGYNETLNRMTCPDRLPAQPSSPATNTARPVTAPSANDQPSWIQKWARGEERSTFGPPSVTAPAGIAPSERVIPFDARKAARDLPVLELAARAYDDPASRSGTPPAGWKALEVATDRKTGFRAVTYQRVNDGKIVVSIAGTNPLSRSDDANDIEAMKGNIPVQFDQARGYIKQVQKKYGSAVDCTGHSLGGGACAYAAASLPAGVHATVINPISPGYLVTKPTVRVDNYIVDGDVARWAYGEKLNRNLMGNVYAVDNSKALVGGGSGENLADRFRIHGVEGALDNIARQAGVERPK